jgi:hypothetical protein
MKVLFAGVGLKEFGKFDFGYHGSSCEFVRVSNALGCVSTLRQYRPDVLFLDRGILWGGADGVLAWVLEEPNFCPSRILLFAGSELLCEFQKPVKKTRWVSEPARYPNIMLLRNLVNQMECEPDSVLSGFMERAPFSARGPVSSTESSLIR